MKIIINFFGILIILISIFLLIKPESIYDWLGDNLDNTSMYISAIVGRLVFGILFVTAAKESKYPTGIKFLGYLMIIAAIIFIFNGIEGFQDFMSSLIPNIKPYAFLHGLFGMGIGGLIIYAFSTNKWLKREVN